MKYRTLGRTGIPISEIGFGAWGIGGRTAAETSYGDTDDRTSLAALARARDNGITFFDTSAAYGDGHSEALIGAAFRASRNTVVLATKAGYDSWDRPPDFSPAAIVASAERSLRRLQTDYVDLLMLHNPPPAVLQSGDVREAFMKLLDSGKIRAWGASTKSPGEAVAALQDSSIPVIQANFNMMDVRALTGGLLEAAARLGAGFIARTPLCFGFLAGTIRHDTKFPPGDHRLGWSQVQLGNWVDGARDLLEAVGATAGMAGVQAALRFCLSFPAVSSTIPGILTPEEADQDAAVSALGPLPQQALDAVLEINRSRQFFAAAARAS